MTAVRAAESRPVRAILFGYIQAQLLRDATDLADSKRSMLALAADNGYTLRSIYIERLQDAPTALYYLMTSLGRTSATTAIAVPALHHLASAGNPITFRDSLQAYGVRVLTVRPHP